MSWWGAWITVAAFAVAGCAGPVSDGGLSDGSTTPSWTPPPSPGFEGPDCGHVYAGEGTTAGPASPSPSPRPCECPYLDGCPVPDVDAAPDIVFNVNETYAVNGTLHLNVTNVGDVAYAYRSGLVTCQVGLYTDTGRKVWLGPCYSDAIAYGTVEPSNTSGLGPRPLRECIRGAWYWYGGSCQETEPLPPGDYRLRHTFCAPAGHTTNCTAAMTHAGFDFRIL